MSLNWKEIDLILKELDLENSLIQKIRQPDFKSLLLDLYKPGRAFPLLINLNQGNVRLHTIRGNKPKKVVLQRFAQFLRSRINGGRISTAFQINNDRIIKIIVDNGEIQSFVYIRLWGGSSNIIVTDSENIILDVFYRRPRQNEISGKYFNPEQAEPKINTNKKEYNIREYNKKYSFDEYIEKYYRELETNKKYNILKSRVENILSLKESQLKSALHTLSNKLGSYENYELYREQAEIVKANIYKIKKGDKNLITENYFHDNNIIKIKLEPTISPGENSELLFLKYKKAKSGLDNILEEISNLKRNLKITLDKKRIFLESDSTKGDVHKLEEFLEGIPKQIQQKEKEKIPGLQFVSGRYTILAGRTAIENDKLLRKYVRGNDYWLHTRDFPGGYIFIKIIKGKSIPLETLIDAGNLAVFFSKAKQGSKAELYYTQVKYLRRAKNTKLGTVLPTNEKNLSIKLNEKRLNRLLGRMQGDRNG